MTLTFYAQPYQLGVEGFYFRNETEWNAKKNTIKNSHGETVEEFEIQFIDGEPLECSFAKTWGVSQCNIARFFEVNDDWNDYAKLSFIIEVDECRCDFDADTVASPNYDVSIYFLDSMRALAEEFIEHGVFGDIPDHLQNYIDFDAIAADLRHDHTLTEIAGQTLIYRMD